MAKIDFGGTLEEVVTSEEFPLEKAREILKGETIAVIGVITAASAGSDPVSFRASRMPAKDTQ